MPTEHDPYEGWEDVPTRNIPRLASKRVLLAEDDFELRTLIASRLRADGCDVIEVATGDRALDVIAASAAEPSATLRVELAIMDVRMPNMSGLEVVYLSRLWDWKTSVLLVTAYPDPELLAEAARLDVDVLQKPFPISSIGKAALAALRRQRSAS